MAIAGRGVECTLAARRFDVTSTDPRLSVSYTARRASRASKLLFTAAAPAAAARGAAWRCRVVVLDAQVDLLRVTTLRGMLARCRWVGAVVGLGSGDPLSRTGRQDSRTALPGGDSLAGLSVAHAQTAGADRAGASLQEGEHRVLGQAALRLTPAPAPAPALAAALTATVAATLCSGL